MEMNRRKFLGVIGAGGAALGLGGAGALAGGFGPAAKKKMDLLAAEIARARESMAAMGVSLKDAGAALATLSRTSVPVATGRLRTALATMWEAPITAGGVTIGRVRAALKYRYLVDGKGWVDNIGDDDLEDLRAARVIGKFLEPAKLAGGWELFGECRRVENMRRRLKPPADELKG